MSKKTLIKLGLIFLIVSLLSLLFQMVFKIDLNTLKSGTASFGPFAPIVFSIMLFLGLSVPLNPISDFLVVTLAALLFPPEIAILATFCSHVAALSVNYWLSRKFEHSILRKLLGEKEAKNIEKLSKNIKLTWIFALRFLLPLTAIGVDFVSYAAGIARLPFKKFLVVSLIPWTIYSALFFFGTNIIQKFSSGLFFVPAGLLMLFSISFFIIIRKLKGNHKFFDSFKLKD